MHKMAFKFWASVLIAGRVIDPVAVAFTKQVPPSKTASITSGTSIFQDQALEVFSRWFLSVLPVSSHHGKDLVFQSTRITERSRGTKNEPTILPFKDPPPRRSDPEIEIHRRFEQFRKLHHL